MDYFVILTMNVSLTFISEININYLITLKRNGWNRKKVTKKETLKEPLYILNLFSLLFIKNKSTPV